MAVLGKMGCVCARISTWGFRLRGCQRRRKGGEGDVRLETDFCAFRFVPSYSVGIMQYLSMKVTALHSIEIKDPHMTYTTD